MNMVHQANSIKKYIYAIGIIILIIVVIRFQQRVSEMHHLEDQLALVQAQGTAVVQTQSSLLTQVAFSNSDAAVKEWAYREGRWYLPNETPIIVMSDQNPSTSTDIYVNPPPRQVQNWQVWWELFFGRKN